MVSATVACLPAAVCLLLLEALFMQISGVSLALTWSCSFVCSDFSCVWASATSFPFSKHWERWHCTRILRPACLFTVHVWGGSSPLSPVQFCSHLCFHKLSCSWLLGGAAAPAGRHVCLQLMWEVGLPSSLVEFSSLRHSPFSQAFLFLVAGHAPLLLPEALWPPRLVYLPSREGFPSPNLQHSGRPTLFPACLICSYCLLLSFSFFPGWRWVCPGGYAALAQSCLWEYRGTVKLTWSRLGAGDWQPGGPPGFSI
jgi:hypothetical protein